MRRLLFLLLASAAFALVIAPPQPIPLPAPGAITPEINIDATIREDNLETAVYAIKLENPTNSTVFVTLPIMFNYPPQHISLKRNGEQVEMDAGAEKGRLAGYSDSVGLEPGEQVTYELEYTVLRTPNEYGIWGLKYSYGSPISSFETKVANAYIPSFPKYSGEIRFEYPIAEVFCTGCTQTDDRIKIDGMDYFGLSWEKRRTPYRAGIFYVLMLSAVILSLARARGAPQKKEATGKQSKRRKI